MQEREYYLAFSLCPGIGSGRFGKILSMFQTAEKAWEKAEACDFEALGIGKRVFGVFDAFRSSFDIAHVLSRFEKQDVSFLTLRDTQYPKHLSDISDAPFVLFYRGNKNVFLHKPIVGVVGSRKMTSYGKRVTENIVSDLCANNINIVSGLAIGVDACAHVSAVENNGFTIAVLGSGVETCFPRENTWLYEKMLSRNGLIVSEYSPGTRASRGTFPSRNRIIAGLCDALLVVEAAEKSGSLLTASYAYDYGREVFAVPGAVGNVMSKGTNNLIKNGAKLCESASDILSCFQSEPGKKRGENIDDKLHNMQLTEEEKKIVLQLAGEAQDVDSLSRKLSLASSQLSILLSGLEMKSCVLRRADGMFEVCL